MWFLSCLLPLQIADWYDVTRIRDSCYEIVKLLFRIRFKLRWFFIACRRNMKLTLPESFIQPWEQRSSWKNIECRCCYQALPWSYSFEEFSLINYHRKCKKLLATWYGLARQHEINKISPFTLDLKGNKRAKLSSHFRLEKLQRRILLNINPLSAFGDFWVHLNSVKVEWT